RKRIPTRATAGSKRQRLDQKTRRGRDKQLRGKITRDE
ncbi:MAG: aminoacyl-tRNA hydrolase, partial [Gammaproteobacteria bacterium]|nr:aminoacyl-tRNA hydrolase [Gammaproteobacteria bacterium]